MERSGGWIRAAIFLTAVAMTTGCGGSDTPAPMGPGADDVATYRVSFDATWSSGTHPQAFPPNPHFSGLIGGTHRAGFVMWATGDLATDGIEDMAELGAKTALRSEVEAAIAAGTAWSVLSGGGINPSPASIALTFDIRADHPLVSLVSMIAPSPDWFVGVAGLDLRPNGQWIDSITVELFPYDAGTDSGPSYTSPNADEAPPTPIRRLMEVPFDANLPVGTFTFVRQ